MLEGTALSRPRSIIHVVVTGTGGHKRHLLLLCEHPEPFLKEKSLWECQHSLGAVRDVTGTSELPPRADSECQPQPRGVKSPRMRHRIHPGELPGQADV